MARGSKGGASRSALQQQDDHEAQRLKEVPVFSFEGMKVHTKLFALYTGLIVLALLASVIVGGAMTSGNNFDVTASETFAQTKTGSNVTFNVTVRNTAAFAGYAYETHVLGVPPGWTVLTGEDLFGLKAGESRTVPITISAAGATPPNRDYTLQVKVLSKASDTTSTYSSRTVGLTVKLLASNVRVSFDERVVQSAFSTGAAAHTAPFTTCGEFVDLPGLSFASSNEFDAGSFSAALSTFVPNQTGWVALDAGADGTIEVNRSTSIVPQRMDLPRAAINQYIANNTAASGNQTVPLRLQSCITNATGWNISLTDFSLNTFAPLPAGDVRPVSFARNELATGSAPVIVRVSNDEPRDLNTLLSFPNLPAGWDTQPRVQNQSLTVKSGDHARLEVTVNVPKATPVGIASVNLTACLASNTNDCQVARPQFNVNATEYFEVKTYLEPATLKTMYIGRSLDILFIATNKGNQPTSFVPDMAPRIDFAFSFWHGTHTLLPQESISLDINESRLFVLRATAEAAPPNPVFAITPQFRGANSSVVQQAFLTVNVLDGPQRSPAGPVSVGNNITVDFLGATASGGRLFETNLISMGPLVDSKQRPVHPDYVAVGVGHAPTPYQYVVQQSANYTGVVHKGFEPFLVGMLIEETRVVWLSPEDSRLPATATLKDEFLVFEIKLSTINA